MTKEEFESLKSGDRVQISNSVMECTDRDDAWAYFAYVAGPFEGAKGCMAWGVTESMSRWQKVVL